MIPIQLTDCKFCRIASHSKPPIDKNWVQDNYDLKEIDSWISKGNNYGVICGLNNIAVLDVDEVDLLDDVKLLPPTFTVKTGSGGFHLYYRIPDMKRKIVLENDIKHYGEIQFTGSMVVGPGSIHPNGNRYEIIADYPIAEIQMDKIQFLIDKYSGPKKKVKMLLNANSNPNIPEDLSEQNYAILNNFVPDAIRHWVTGEGVNWKSRFYMALYLRDRGFDNTQIESFLKPFYSNLPRSDKWKNNWNHFMNSGRVLSIIRSRTDLKFPNTRTLIDEGLVDDKYEDIDNLIYK